MRNISLTAILIQMFPCHQTLGFSINRRSLLIQKHQQQRLFRSLFNRFSHSSTPEVDSNSKVVENSRQTEQDGFVKQMEDWRGTTRSTSEFVTHFIASKSSDRNITVEDAILSVLPHDADISIHTTEATERKFKVLEREEDNVLGRLELNFRNDPSEFPLNQQLNPLDLLAMGSIWFLPADAPRDPALGLKPVRLEAKNITSIMTEGDYLRVHHMPRRFPEVHDFDWGRELNEECDDNSSPGVIIHEDVEKGFIIINKPAGVPVHSTVDNALENVAGAIGRSIIEKDRTRLEQMVDGLDENLQTKTNQTLTWQRNGNRTTCNSGNGKRKKKENPLLYVVAPQRLDQNTSGVFVVATKKIFAGYFAKLLRTKTEAHLKANDDSTATSKSPISIRQIQKKYRCLVCIQPNKRFPQGDTLTSVWDEVEKLHSLKESGELIRHYLEPTKRAPRIYSEDYTEDWLECLMKITYVGGAVPVVGNNAAVKLCESLWGKKDNKPQDCVAVMQVEVELLTGRAHQIRGQLSALGYSLCGDAMYGGTSLDERNTGESQPDVLAPGYMDSERLALQCCELQFLDPDYVTNKKGREEAVRSNRVNKFRLQKSWWTPYIDKCKSQVEDTALNTATTSDDDLKTANAMKTIVARTTNSLQSNEVEEIKKIQLSPGQHKYVVVKAMHPLEGTEWFVKTASPRECGGVFHADVARDLVKELNNAGYDTMIFGGGRIDYDTDSNHAHVYGFSYGFGKGDHEFVSLLIEQEGITSSFDDSDDLY